MRSKLSLLGIFLVLLAVNISIFLKESALAHGRTVILELVPVDPRSLMQGDYMQLRYGLAEKVADGGESSGLTYVTLDARGVAISVSPTPAPGLLPLRYRRNDDRVVFDAESYFFQEGQGELFEQAKYGELKVDDSGTPILVGLLDSKLQPINP